MRDGGFPENFLSIDSGVLTADDVSIFEAPKDRGQGTYREARRVCALVVSEIHLWNPWHLTLIVRASVTPSVDEEAVSQMAEQQRRLL